MNVRVEVSKRLMLVNAASSTVYRLLDLTVLLWLQQYLIDEVTQDEYAVYRLVVGLLVFAHLLSGGLGGGQLRFVTEAYARGDDRRVVQLVSTMGWIAIGVGLVVSAGSVALSFVLDDLVSIAEEVQGRDPAEAARIVGDAKIMFALLMCMAAARIAVSPFRLGLQVKQKFLWTNLLALASTVVRMALLFALLFGVSTRVLWVVVAQVPGTVLELALAVWLSRRVMPIVRMEKGAFRAQLIRPVLAFGSWTLVAWAAVAVREAVTLLMLNQAHRFEKVQLSAFSLGHMVDSRVRQTAASPIPTLQPALTAMHTTAQDDRLRRAYFRFSRYMLWVLLLPALFLVLYRDDLFWLYLRPDLEQDPQKHEVQLQLAHLAAIAMGLLLLRLPFTFVQAVLLPVALARGYARGYGIRAFTLETTTLAVMWWLVVVERMGAVGAALATFAVAAVLNPVLYWWWGLQVTRARAGPWLRKAVLRGVLPGLVATPVWLLAAEWIPPTSWAALVADGVIGTLAYCGVALWTLDAPERQDAGRVIARLRGARSGHDPLRVE